MSDSDKKEPIIQPEDTVEIKAEDQTPAEAIPEQMVMAAPSEIETAVSTAVSAAVQGLTEQVTVLSDQVQAVVEAVKPTPAEVIPAETILPEPEPAPEKTVGESIQALTEKVVELTDQVKAVVEVSNPAPAVEPEQVPEVPTIETVKKEVAEQVTTAVEEKVAAVIEEVQQAAQKAEVKAEEAKTELVAAVTEAVAIEIATQAAASQTTPQANGNSKLAKVMAKHVTASTLFNNLMILIIIAAGAAFAVLYSTERVKNTQVIEKYEKTMTEMTQAIRDLSEDLVSLHIVKNENIESAIEKKIKQFTTEGMPKAQAIPRAYIDPQVIEEATRYMPASVLKQPYVKDLVIKQLQDISSFAASGLQEESLSE